MKSLDIKRLLFFIIICQLAGIIGSIFTVGSIPTWYASLVKPEFTPPGWVFAPVWILLYLLMGISAYLVYSSNNNKNKKINTNTRAALIIFAIQLVLNLFWSIIFFGAHSIVGGLAIIILLWFSILATMIKFYEINRNSALLLIPYLLWVSFAAVLNLYVWMLN
jgi:tryptophan-rich sensory protein